MARPLFPNSRLVLNEYSFQAFPLLDGPKDAAFVVTLAPGAYTIIGSAADGVSTGVVLVEVYVVP